MIGVVCSLDESVLAETLFVHLEMIKSLFIQLDRLKNSGWDVLVDVLVTSYALAQDRD